jgi:type IV secretory pathway TrbF-like protein
MKPEPTFLDGRRAFEGTYSNITKGRDNWRLVGLISLCLLAFETATLCRLALTSRFTPYVVEVDRLGRAVAFGPAEPIRKTDHRIIVAELSRFVSSVRTVYPDPTAQRDALLRAYQYVTADARAFLDSYFADPSHDPRLLAQTSTRTADVESVIQVPGSDTWKILWTETSLPRLGVPTTTAWEAYLHLRLQPPSQADRIQANPLGIWIQSITWSQIASSTPKGIRP